jgi:exodeoxyribonuclease V alpha subunit
MMQDDLIQEQAISRALEGDDLLITGGAGTGKTTIIQQIANGMNGNCMILAPTGKAAARIKECTGFFAQTVHRALGWDGETIRPQAAMPFTSPIIIDEASMMDSWLLAKVIERTPPQIILVGDAAQLAPVGKGQPFHDLLKLKPEMVVELKTCYRNKEAIHHAANQIRNGEAPESSTTENESFKIVPVKGGDTSSAAQSMVTGWVEKGFIDPKQDILLAPRYGADGEDMAASGDINALNRAIQAIVNPHKDGERWKIGDRVICCKNFSKEDMWNGDLGEVYDINMNGRPWVRLDRKDDQGCAIEIEISKEMERELKPAYCLSVHKAQGSQFRRVIFICLNKHRFMLSRSLIYTAVTRAKKGCCIVGEPEAFYRGINTIQNKKTILPLLAAGKVPT